MSGELNLPIDEGLSYRIWRELELTAKGPKSWEEETRLRLPVDEPTGKRLRYPFLARLKPGDSVFVDWSHRPNRIRSAALNLATKRGWHVITKKSYEGKSYGVRIFRLS